jgi:hypothetical protein
MPVSFSDLQLAFEFVSSGRYRANWRQYLCLAIFQYRSAADGLGGAFRYRANRRQYSLSGHIPVPQRR